MNCSSCKVEIAAQSAVGGKCARCASKAPAPKTTTDTDTIVEHEKGEHGHGHAKAEPADHGKKHR